MNFPPNSQESSGSMGEAGGYWDGFVNGDDSFHNVINMLDFPLESVEDDKCVAAENWEAQFPSLGPFSSEIVQGFTPVFRSDFAEDVPYCFVENDAASDRKLLPVVTEFSSTNFPLESSHPRNPSLLQTPSQNSVLESSSSCSAGKNLSTSSELPVPVRTRTKIPRSLTFSRWHLLSPLTPPKKILHSKGKEKKNMQLSQHSNEFDMKEHSYPPQHMPYKRCTHCQAEKTPQWRAGPMGPNTLCNACGVCYRKRKHLPMYRLIASHGSKMEKCSFTRGKEKKIRLTSEIKEDSTNQLPEDCQIAEDLTYQLPCKSCTLCNVTKTPQRREGLVCNARGVRSRSGRLLLESLPSPDPAKNERMNTKNREKKKELSGVPNDSEIMGFATHQPMQVKRCTHCQVAKTPQWREGPNGPKTLCNACGVRYRSGRLVPEYRPAVSPTFVPYMHSNKHRKVIEMRKKAIPEISV